MLAHDRAAELLGVGARAFDISDEDVEHGMVGGLPTGAEDAAHRSGGAGSLDVAVVQAAGGGRPVGVEGPVEEAAVELLGAVGIAGRDLESRECTGSGVGHGCLLFL